MTLFSTANAIQNMSDAVKESVAFGTVPVPTERMISIAA
jgi:hypothetical protein